MAVISPNDSSYAEPIADETLEAVFNREKARYEKLNNGHLAMVVVPARVTPEIVGMDMLAMRPTFNQKVFVLEYSGNLQQNTISAERLRRDVVIHSGQICRRVDKAYALSAKSFADAKLKLGS